MVFGIRCDVDIFKLTASDQSIYREVYEYIYELTYDMTNARATLDKQLCVITPTFVYHDQ